jgi:hypothetical protein
MKANDGKDSQTNDDGNRYGNRVAHFAERPGSPTPRP